MLVIPCRDFCKVLSSQSFFKGKRLWVLKSNMADKTSYHSYFPATAARFVKKTVPIRTSLNWPLVRSLFYVFRKDRQCKFIFLLSPSLDVINIISVWALKAMEVASETLQRSRHTLLAVGSYLQPCPWGQGIKFRLFLTGDTINSSCEPFHTQGWPKGMFSWEY